LCLFNEQKMLFFSRTLWFWLFRQACHCMASDSVAVNRTQSARDRKYSTCCSTCFRSSQQCRLLWLLCFSSDFLPQVLLALCDVVATRHAQSHDSGVCPKWFFSPPGFGCCPVESITPGCEAHCASHSYAWWILVGPLFSAATGWGDNRAGQHKGVKCRNSGISRHRVVIRWDLEACCNACTCATYQHHCRPMLHSIECCCLARLVLSYV